MGVEDDDMLCCMHAYDLIKIVVKCTLYCAKNYLIV
jgi:hypothetical protein